MKIVTLVAVLFAFTILISSCQKEVELSDLQIHFESSFPLKDLDFKGEQCLAVGGRNFNAGFIVRCNPTTNESTIDSIQSKSLFSIEVNGEDIVCAGVYTLATNRGGTWKTQIMPDLFIMRGSIIYEDQIVAVGGAGLSQGIEIVYDLDLNEWTSQKNSVHDLYFIEKINDKIFSGGYGKFSGHKDFQDYDINELEGHFLDITYSEGLGYYLLDASGRILHSTDEGVNWTEIRGSNSSGISDFKDLEIKGSNLYISAEDRIEFTSLDQIDWETIPIEGMASINKLKAFNDRLYFVTESGKIGSIAN